MFNVQNAWTCTDHCFQLVYVHGAEKKTLKPQNDYTSHHLGMATACAIVHGVVIKVVDMTQDHGLRMPAAIENMFYLIALLIIIVLSTVVPGGQSFIAYHFVYHGLIKAKADTLKHLITGLGVCITWIFLAWKGYLSIDWLFVALLTGVSTAWSILNNRILHMGDTYMNQMRVDILLLMANLASFDYSRFVCPALITVASQVSYSTTKAIAKTQAWYVNSKQEDMVAKNYLTAELFTGFGICQWTLGYSLMLWEGIHLNIGPFPAVFGSYYLVWESFDSLFDFFNKGTFTSKGIKRILHMCYFVLDLSLHILFVLHGQGTHINVLGLTIPQTVQGRLLYLAMWISVWIAACLLSARLGFRRQFKYAGYGFYYVQHASMVRLPAYAVSPLLITAAWAVTYGNICYLFRIWSAHFPQPKVVFAILAVGLPVVCIFFNIFYLHI